MNKILLLTLSVAVNLAFTVSYHAQSGSFDTTFGTGGMTITPMPNLKATLRQSVVQNDGKIVSLIENSDESLSYRDALVRFNADGSVDPTFGSGGWSYVTWTAPNSGKATKIKIQDVGGEQRFVLAGSAACGRSTCLRAERYTNAGQPDGSFGSSGSTVISTGWAAESMTIDPVSNKILLTGATTPLIRLKANGTPDATFGTNGISATKSGVRIMSLYATASGKVLAAGWTTSGNTRFVTVARMNSNGTMDDGSRYDSTPGDSFGTGGKVVLGLGGNGGEGRDVTVDANGRIVVVGQVMYGGTAIANFDAVIAGLTPNGQLDTTFGTGGKTVVNTADRQDLFRTVVTDSSGRFVASGEGRPQTPAGDYLVARFGADGKIDGSFATAGVFTKEFYGYYDTVMDSLVQTDPACACEKIIVAGYALTTTSTDNKVMPIIRLLQ